VPAQIVTLLFTDLVGSSALLEQLGDDAGERMRRTHFGLLRDAVAEAGGEEVKNLGDGLMVALDSGVRAVECAIAMQRAFDRHNRQPGTPRLDVRVGLHVGEPIRDEDDFFGTAVVVAKRLCDAAEGGQILASDLVRGLVASRGGFTFQSVGEVALKGMGHVPAFEVAWVPALSTPDGRLPHDPRGVRMVGRLAELADLDHDLERAAAGRLGVVLLVGEPGVGKTRLAHELLVRRAGEVIGLTARAYPLGATASLGLWVEALERHLRTLPTDELEHLCGGSVDDLAALIPAVGAIRRASLTDEPPRIRLLGGLATLLARMAERAPVVLVLDDVHLADGSSWEALNYLARNLHDSRVLLVLAARTVELGEARIASDVLLGLDQEGLLRRVTVDALNADQVRELAEIVIERPAPQALVDWVMERAQGSPLFANGLLRALIDEGADLEHPHLESLPEDLKERVAARLQHLEPQARSVLEILSVLGYRAEFGDLMRVSGKTLDELAPLLEQLVHERFISEEEQGRQLTYEIAHPLIQEAIYQSVGGARRRALHRHVARELVEADRLGAAAPHFVRAAEPGDDEAIDGLCGALAQAEVRQHHREALALLEALTELIPPGDKRWLKVLDAMPLQPEWVVDHRADAGAEIGVRVMRQCEQLLEQSSDRARLAAVKFNLGSLLAWGLGEVDEARRLVAQAIDLFAEAGDERGRMLAGSEMSYVLGLGDDEPGHEREARRVLAEARQAGDRLVELQALCSLMWAIQARGGLGESSPVTEDALAVARAEGKAYRVSYVLGQQGSVAAYQGRMADAVRKFEEAEAAYPMYRDTVGLDFLAVTRLLNGDLAGVPPCFRETVAWTGGVSRRRAIGSTAAVVALAELGRADEAAAVLALTEGAFDGRDWWGHSGLVTWSRGMFEWLSGDSRTACATLLRGGQRQVDYFQAGWGRQQFADLAEAALEAGDAHAAAWVSGVTARDSALGEGPTIQALADMAEGCARLVNGDAAAAVPRFEAAVGGFEAGAWRLYEARCRALLGRALAADDRTRAAEAIGTAAEQFAACGAAVRHGWALRALEGLGTAGRRAKTAVTGPDALTKREREVARLAAEGRSAREIAQELFIGERTVETHLANAYAKLGVSSKVELVRLAPELGL